MIKRALLASVFALAPPPLFAQANYGRATPVANAAVCYLNGEGQLTNCSGSIITGSVPANSGSCAINTQLGGNTAGSFKANGACAAGTIILTFSVTATNGWTCDMHDLTTVTDLINQSAYTTTTATFSSVTMAASDLVGFKCTGF